MELYLLGLLIVLVGIIISIIYFMSKQIRELKKDLKINIHDLSSIQERLQYHENSINRKMLDITNNIHHNQFSNNNHLNDEIDNDIDELNQMNIENQLDEHQSFNKSIDSNLLNQIQYNNSNDSDSDNNDSDDSDSDDNDTDDNDSNDSDDSDSDELNNNNLNIEVENIDENDNLIIEPNDIVITKKEIHSDLNKEPVHATDVPLPKPVPELVSEPVNQFLNQFQNQLQNQLKNK